MAYVPDNLRLVDYDVGSKVPKQWFYTTVNDADATIVAAVTSLFGVGADPELLQGNERTDTAG